MIRAIALIALMGTLISTSLAQSPIPDNVMVGTEEVAGKDFKAWVETDLAKYDGVFAGDVGGDSSGKLTFKAGKAKKGEFPVFASGSYSQTPAGMAATVLKFENAVFFGDPENVFAAGPLNLVFVKQGKTRGVIIGNIFLPKE